MLKKGRPKGKKYPYLRKKFCKYGHDISICGRDRNGKGNCIDCLRGIHPLNVGGQPRQFCANNHDTFICGRGKNGFCKYCIMDRGWKRVNITNKDGSQFTIFNFNSLYLEQNGKCAICGVHQDKLSRKLSVDHNHKTHIVRGLLCNFCNVRIGSKENIEWNIKADEYLK